MCGIVGVVGKNEAAPFLIEGLKRLEYRGYDSAGIATLSAGGIQRRRSEGKILKLEERLFEDPVTGNIGIGHTRWATHGIPSERNAHPHATSKVAVVHNGIIENFQDLRKYLSDKGCNFQSDTDTEVIVHLVNDFIESGDTHAEAIQKTVASLDGAFAVAIMIASDDAVLYAARRGSPLAIGYGEGEMYIGSDAIALAPMTQRITYLHDGDWTIVNSEGVIIRDENGLQVEREICETGISGDLIEKGGHPHFMIKEIYEQPQVIGDTLSSLFNPVSRTITLPDLGFDLATINKVTIVGCGTAYYAGLVAKYWIEQLAAIPVEVDIGSEFRYRTPPLSPGDLALFVSQSGETLDTLVPLRYCKEEGQHTLSVVNVLESAIARESDAVLQTLAGPEIGVASTKAFTTQLVTLACFAIKLAKVRNTIDHDEEAALVTSITEVPARAAEILSHDERIRSISEDIAAARDVLYLGRGLSYPIALEGALKLKEISYIHAEGYAAGEMKHGPIALIDEHVPVIVIAPGGPFFEKTLSNVEQVVARGGRVVFFSDQEGVERVGDNAVFSIALPKVDPFVTPILYALPVQLLAYHTAVIKGTDVDQPRNLAKSVTVE